MSYKLYGIKNCDTVKKARRELESIGVEYEMIDFKKTPPSVENLKKWQSFLGEVPVNKRGTTFRKIKDLFESATADKQIKILIENSSAIKRPILENNNKVLGIGFKVGDYSSLI